MLEFLNRLELVLLVCLALLGWAAVSRARIREWPLNTNADEFHPIGLFDVFFGLALLIGSQFVGQAIFCGMEGLTFGAIEVKQLTSIQKASLSWWIKLSELVAAGILLALLGLRYGRPFWNRLILNPTANLKVGLLASLLILPMILWIHVAISNYVAYQHETIENIVESQSWITIAVGWFTAVLVAPIAEEIVCRGAIQTWLRRVRVNVSNEEMSTLITGGIAPSREVELIRTRKKQTDHHRESQSATSHPVSLTARWSAILITAGFFAFLHAGQGGAPISLFLLAVALGYIYEQTRSLIPCIVVHLVLNAHTMLWLTLSSFEW